VVGIVLRTLEDLERVLWVANEVLVFLPFPLRLSHIQAEVLQFPSFEFSTSVNSMELNLLVGSSSPFDFQIHNLFAEALYSIVITKVLIPPTNIPSPEPSPEPIISPSPSPTPSPTPSPPPSPSPEDEDEGLVTWNVKFAVLPIGTADYMYLEYHIFVSRDDGSSIFRHYEIRNSTPFTLSTDDLGAGVEVSTVIVSVSVAKTSLSKTWNVLATGTMSGILYVNEHVSITAPPFNGQGEPNIFWNDIQTHTV